MTARSPISKQALTGSLRVARNFFANYTVKGFNTVNKASYLMKQTFTNWNSVKRYQTKYELEVERGNNTQAQYYQLQMYKAQAKLELGLRGLQREVCSTEECMENEETPLTNN
jgi:hypothetical protein